MSPVAVGLLLGGVIIGPYVLGFFSTDRPIADFIAELGKLLLMFFAGLEIDLALFRRVRNRSIVAALLVGKWIAAWVISRAFGYSRGEQLTV
jgi:Na+:H+ antiporter